MHAFRNPRTDEYVLDRLHVPNIAYRLLQCWHQYLQNSTNLIRLAGWVQRTSTWNLSTGPCADLIYRYLLATCTFTPLYGRLCNVLGRKGANRTALFFAAAGVIMCGLSSSMEMLIVARFVCRSLLMHRQESHEVVLSSREWEVEGFSPHLRKFAYYALS